MAKQRGIHQIKGKINNLCYYEQKYIRGGLIRRINEAMSERLKTDPAFEKTRFYNNLFGVCSNYAKIFLSIFGSRNKFLFSPYRQATLTRYLFDNKILESQSSIYPTIGFFKNSGFLWVSLIDNLMKNNLSKNFPSLDRVMPSVPYDDSISVTIPSSELEDYCSRYNVKSLVFSHTKPLYIYTSGFDPNIQKYNSPEYNSYTRLVDYVWNYGDGDLEIVLSTGDVDDAFTFWIIYVSPVLYQIGGRNVTKSTGATCGIINFVAT